MIKLGNLEVETRQRWEQNLFFEHGKEAFSKESSYLNSLAELAPWEPYENYMMARLIVAIPGKTSLLHIKFPPKTAEDNRIHTHLYSDRLVTVLEGSGYFLIAPLGEAIKSLSVTVGDRIWMPRGIRHTWYSGKNGLIVESIHSPFFAFNDPDILAYDHERGYLDFNSDGTFVERKGVDFQEASKIKSIAAQYAERVKLAYLSPTRAIIISPGNKRIVSVYEDHRVKVWDIENAIVVFEFKLSFAYRNCYDEFIFSFSPDGTKIMCNTVHQ